MVLTAFLYILYVAGSYHVLNRSKMPLSVSGRVEHMPLTSPWILSRAGMCLLAGFVQVGFVLGVSVMVTFLSLMTAIFWVRTRYSSCCTCFSCSCDA